MSVPTNISPSTATVLDPLPYTETMDPSEAPTSALTPTCGSPDAGVWWVYTPTTGVTAIGITIASSSGPSDYQPSLSIWTGTLPLTLTQLSQCCYTFYDPTHVRIAVAADTPHYLLVTNGNGGTPPSANLTLTVEVLMDTVPAGSLHVTSDIGNQATIIVSAADGTSLRAVGMAASEQGDFLPDGHLAIMAEDPADANTAVGIELWNVGLTAKTTVTSIIRANQLSLSPIRTDRDSTFYVASVKSAAPAIINTVSAAGVVGVTSWTLPANSAALHSMGVTQDGETLYYAHETNNTPIYAYDLGGSVALPDFLAAPGADFRWQRDIWVRANGDVLITQRNTNTNAYVVLRYNSAAALQTTYTIATTTGRPRMGLSLDETYFWVMSFPSAGVSRFQKFLIAGGGSAAVNFTVDQNDNVGDGPLFGPASSCPLLVLPVALQSITPPPGPGTTRAIRRVRRFTLPSSDSNKAMFISELEVLLQPGIGDGDASSQGYDPLVNLSISKDGGKPFGPEQSASAGKQGEYTKRVRFRRTPNRYRNGVVEIVVTDPNDWTLVDVVCPSIKEGSS